MPEPRRRIVIPGDYPPQVQGSPHLERLEAYGEVVLYTDLPKNLDEQLERARGAEVILNSRMAVRWPREALEAVPTLRLISTASVGVDNLDLVACRELGITVCHQAGNTSRVVAEHTLALMLAVAKRLAVQTREVKAGRWDPGWNVGLRGKTLGVVGTGASGAEMARLSSALGMEVLAWTFHPSPERAAALGVRFVDLDTLLRESEVVSLHVALTPDTRHLIGAREFGLMKPGAILVNGARGAVVDTDAFVEALRSGRLRGAGLDVFEQEPLPAGHPLTMLDEVVLTPHAADATPEAMDYLNRDAVDHIIAFLEGRPQGVVV